MHTNPRVQQEVPNSIEWRLYVSSVYWVFGPCLFTLSAVSLSTQEVASVFKIAAGLLSERLVEALLYPAPLLLPSSAVGVRIMSVRWWPLCCRWYLLSYWCYSVLLWWSCSYFYVRTSACVVASDSGTLLSTCTFYQDTCVIMATVQGLIYGEIHVCACPLSCDYDLYVMHTCM